ncbi:conserved hypothetical protein [Leptospira interrogans serovar Manilae]|uniref:Uncharacterized protein n=1 Tax=Leptospira interrogans serovar Manilae TaxID=214675 RepID=A0AAQ1NX64_LEPIR|nr:hypothetical protein [Leptospira interrogans]AKP27172.1 hypothetical protein LIMLP_15385 [Leptospira interrogans serovar Manilae]AKP30944.1 hypothetical protein LIMHP_15380 [Leptospira interrogans serovar Manilae]EMJ55831.1 hypothetical protein LEP1GSC013_0982 [Leptospira interrogans serovar Valbuzzi str. Duyster]ENO73143.1 hypothetical protein LEP1GSC012_3336 [Leptospira interrogans serovar Valbuzzi str. Valbuzzi]EYU64145.1 hypothetical protein CI00_09360 [Leptospira interrogans serovar Ma
MNIFPGKIKYGCLWGMLIPFFASVGVTVLLLKDNYGKTHTIADWLVLAGKHILFFGGILVSILFALVFGLRSRIQNRSKRLESFGPS